MVTTCSRLGRPSDRVSGFDGTKDARILRGPRKTNSGSSLCGTAIGQPPNGILELLRRHAFRDWTRELVVVFWGIGIKGHGLRLIDLRGGNLANRVLKVVVMVDQIGGQVIQ